MAAQQAVLAGAERVLAETMLMGQPMQVSQTQAAVAVGVTTQPNKVALAL